MSIPATTGRDALSTFISEVDESLAKLKRRMAEEPNPAGSRALAFAVAAGLPPKMAYTVKQTARYVGVSKETLDAEHRAGRLAYFIPRGKERGSVIRVDEVDRWLNENE